MKRVHDGFLIYTLMFVVIVALIVILIHKPADEHASSPQPTMIIHVDKVVIGNTEVVETVLVEEEDAGDPLNVSWGSFSLDIEPRRIINRILGG